MEIDWAAVTSATYRIEQSFRYRYPGPIADLRQRLVVSPPTLHGGQRRIARRYRASVPAREVGGRDAFGNAYLEYHVDRLDGEIEFAFEAVVRRDAGALHSVPRAAIAVPLDVPRRLTRPDATLTALGAGFLRAHRDPEARARAISAFVHAEMTYTKNATDIFTTASTAFAMRRGVCQDYAHVALAIARAAALEARYVSGHLLGEGATHAWIEALVPDGDRMRVVALDPTHGRAPDLRYIVVAVGRDYDDVAPASGVFTAPYPGRLDARHRVDVVEVTAAA